MSQKVAIGHMVRYFETAEKSEDAVVIKVSEEKLTVRIRIGEQYKLVSVPHKEKAVDGKPYWDY